MEREHLEEMAREAIHARIREGVKAVIEQVLEEEMRQRLGAGHRERTPLRRGWRNGHYSRGLITPVGRLEEVRVPRDREGEFVTELFQRCQRMTGDVEEAVLEMYLQGVSVRRMAEISRALSRVRVSKDAVSRIAQRPQGELLAWRQRRLDRPTPTCSWTPPTSRSTWGSGCGSWPCWWRWGWTRRATGRCWRWRRQAGSGGRPTGSSCGGWWTGGCAGCCWW